MLTIDTYYMFAIVSFSAKDRKWNISKDQMAARKGRSYNNQWALFEIHEFSKDSPTHSALFRPAQDTDFSLFVPDTAIHDIEQALPRIPGIPTGYNSFIRPFSVSDSGVIFNCTFPAINSGSFHIRYPSETKTYNLYDCVFYPTLSRDSNNKLHPSYSLYDKNISLISGMFLCPLTHK